MANYAENRRRMVNTQGRPMTLKRFSGTLANGASITNTTISVTGVLTAYSQTAVAGDVKQGDALVNITADEITTAGWNIPRLSDKLTIDGNSWAIKGVDPLYYGNTAIGFTMWVRGGQG